MVSHDILDTLGSGTIDTRLLIEAGMKLLEIAVVLIFGLMAVLFLKGLSRRLIAARILDEANAGPFYRLSRDIILVVMVLLTIYILTGSRFIILVIAVLMAALILASWDLLMNLAAYYAIIVTRIVSKQEYVVLPNGVRGWVRDVRPLFTIIETRHGVYSVPNIVIVRLGVMSKREPSYYRITLRVWGLQSSRQLIDNTKSIIESVIAERLSEEERTAALHRIIIDEISEDSVTLRLIIGMPHTEPRPEKVAEFMQKFSERLQEHGINHSITLEEPEGYEQRWGAALA